MEVFELLHALIGKHGQDITWWQMSLRAVVIFLFGLVLVRAAGKRVFGKWTAIDIVLSIVIGSNLSRALTNNAPFEQTLIATAVLVALHSVMIGAAVRWPALGHLLKGRGVPIVKDGAPDEQAMRRHGIGEQDLEEALRDAGLEDASKVRVAYLERNGDISVVKS
ncbi:MAG TPA: YetF domain-containing protein [Caulobacteraceae bacterium]|jgi:uncharacterized membrane protein YcaP (DUF421 family)